MIRTITTAIILLFSIRTGNSYNFNSEIRPDSHIVILRGIYYEFGSSKIQPDGEIDLKRVSYAMNNISDMHDIKLLLTPHVDSIEYLKFGKKLAIQRLRGVIEFLNKEGIPKSRIVEGKFQKLYLSPNNSKENMSLNRCVSFIVVE